MSTTVELVRANERYARLRAAVEALAADACSRLTVNEDGMVDHESWSHSGNLVCGLCAGYPHTTCIKPSDLRALLAAADS